MTSSQSALPPLDAASVVAIVEINWQRWGWDSRLHKIVTGKLSRGSRTIAPLDVDAATSIVSMCREGCGVIHALKEARIRQRTFFAWIYQAQSADPVDKPYREFRLGLIAAFEDNTARTGIKDDTTLRSLACLEGSG